MVLLYRGCFSVSIFLYQMHYFIVKDIIHLSISHPISVVDITTAYSFSKTKITGQIAKSLVHVLCCLLPPTHAHRT